MITHAQLIIQSPFTVLTFTKVSDSYFFLVDQQLLDLLGYSSPRSVSKRYGNVSIGRRPHITAPALISALLNCPATSPVAEQLILSHIPLLERLQDAWTTA